MSDYRILSLDVSGSSTGWSFRSKRSRTLACGTIKTKSSDVLAKRLTDFRVELTKIFKKHKPNIVLIEDTFIGKNPKVNKLLSKFGGVAEQLVYEHLEKAPIIISNKTVKAFFCVKKKEKLFEVMHDLLNWPPTSTFKSHNDIADAVAQMYYFLDKENLKRIREEVEYGFRYK